MNKYTLCAAIVGIIVGRFAFTSLPMMVIAFAGLAIAAVSAAAINHYYLKPRKRIRARLTQIMLDTHLDHRAVQRLRQSNI